MAISTRTGNILSKLIRKLDELCVYTDSNAQLRSLTLAEPDGTEHDSPIGTVIKSEHSQNFNTKIPDDGATNSLVLCDMTLSPGVWLVIGQVRVANTAASGDVIYCSVSSAANPGIGKYGSTWCAGVNSELKGIGAVAHYVSPIEVKTTTTYHLTCCAQRAAEGTSYTKYTTDSSNKSGTYMQAVRIA